MNWVVGRKGPKSHGGGGTVPAFLPADRLTTWQPGVTYNGGIPVRNTIFTTVNPTGVAATDVAAINAAVAGCPAGQVVALGAGTFAFDGSSGSFCGPIVVSKAITVRGAGAGSTILAKTDGAYKQVGLNTNTATSSGAVLHFASTTGVVLVNGMSVDDGNPANPGVIPPGTTILSFNSTSVTMSANVTGAGVLSGDLMTFTQGQGPHSGSAFVLGLIPNTYWANGGPDAAGGNTATIGSGGANLASDGVHGATSITMVNSSGFTAGMIVILDELSGGSFVPDVVTYNAAAGYQIWSSSDYKTTWKLHNPNIAFIDDFTPGTNPTQPGTFGDFANNRLDRPHCEIKEILSVVGNVVTFTTPIHGNYRVANTAQITYYSDVSATTKIDHISGVGLENMTFTGFDSNVISFNFAKNSWAQNVEWDVWLGQACTFFGSFRCEARHFFGHGAAFPRPTSGAYQICFDQGSSDCLVEDGVSVLPNKVMVCRRSGAGCVVAYCHTDMGMIDYSPTWIEIGINGSHLVGCHHMLFEGNYGQNMDSDNTHGASVYHTFFRNWARGIRAPFTDPDPTAPSPAPSVDDASQTGNGPRRCAGCQDYSYWFSFVGNVMGASGQHSGWIYENNNWGNGTPSIWLLGWCSGYDNTTTQDPQVMNNSFAGHVIRDGNWDWLNSAQKWENTPATFTIPNSMYLPNAGASPPAFWGGNTWPWVDPSTGTTYTLPARARFLAWQTGGPNPAL